jgi:hypothetical protein
MAISPLRSTLPGSPSELAERRKSARTRATTSIGSKGLTTQSSTARSGHTATATVRAPSTSRSKHSTIDVTPRHTSGPLIASNIKSSSTRSCRPKFRRGAWRPPLRRLEGGWLRHCDGDAHRCLLDDEHSRSHNIPPATRVHRCMTSGIRSSIRRCEHSAGMDVSTSSQGLRSLRRASRPGTAALPLDRICRAMHAALPERRARQRQRCAPPRPWPPAH